MELEAPGTEMSAFARTIYEQKYAWKNEAGEITETWEDTAARVTFNVMGALGYSPGDAEYDGILRLITERKFLPGGRYLYASGRGLHQTQNCLLLRAEDSREGWAETMSNAAMALMTGAGIGIDYTDLRASGTPIKKTGGEASGPISLMKIINEIGRNVMQGGSRRSAIWAGLNWKHPDIFDFIRVKDWSPEVRALKAKDFNFPATMDMTNVSVILDDEFFEAYENEDHPLFHHACNVYWITLGKMVTTGEPGFSVDTGDNAGETLRNACTEVTSSDDSDICNLGSVNMGRIDTLDEFSEAVRLGTLFLLAGTVYSHLPYEKVTQVRSKNRRLGLGVMGVHEWLLKRGLPYGADPELESWLNLYKNCSDFSAEFYSEVHGLSVPVKVRAIAPTGTIGIIGETTTGIEPIFCVAYKRRYKSAKANGNDVINYQYVIDPTAERLIEEGVDPTKIEDAYMLSYQVERRVEFQAWVQKFVDHGISSTINLPYPITDEQEQVDFGDMLIKYLPSLRGITCYPDGARDGQPLSVVPYNVAINQVGVVFEETEERCVGGECGT
jgi:ribonucleoside-diphosphate reductase alpha chain